MKNLFICHTQAQLILASGLVRGRFKEDINDLILFVDFGLTQRQKERLNGTFNRILFLQSIYPAEYNTLRAKLKWYPNDWKEIKKFVYDKFDRAFAVCDWLLLVQKTLKRVYSINASVEIAWLEDGITAYYSDSDMRGGLDSNSLTSGLRKFLFKYLLGAGKFYDRDFRETGGLKCLKTVYTCYPNSVREPYRSRRELIEITDEEYMLGLKAIYETCSLDLKLPAVILVVDKLDRYEHPEIVKDSIIRFIRESRREGKKVICKFHPRETMIWEVFDDCQHIDKSIGIENTYLSLMPQKDLVTIAGIKSTGLMSAKKLGFHTLSLFMKCGEDNRNLISFYNGLGIDLV